MKIALVLFLIAVAIFIKYALMPSCSELPKQATFDHQTTEIYMTCNE